MKIHNKIIILLVGVFLFYTLIFSVFIYYSISDYAFNDFYKRLEIRAVTTAKIELEHPNDVTTIVEMNQDYLEKLPNQKTLIFKVLNGELPVSEFPKQLPLSFFQDIKNNGSQSYRSETSYYAGIYYITSDKEEYIVVVSAENYFNTHHIKYLRNLMFSTLGYSILLIVVISLIFSRTLIQPLTNIIKGVTEISSENLHLRLKVPDNNDALSKLTLTFNDMLNRLETSFETQKNFISNASHELNTPLTSIIGEADLALSKTRQPEEYITALTNIMEQAEKLDKKTKALLFLAQTGYDGKSQKLEALRIDELILDVKETVGKIKSKAKISLDFNLLPENPEKLKINGNIQLLHLALSNVIMNACKYSDYDLVHVGIGASDNDIFIFVKDTGIGIPANELKFIYDPYFRASNTGRYEGYGIGMPLARNIIKMHKGSIDVSSQEGMGTTVTIKLPAKKV